MTTHAPASATTTAPTAADLLRRYEQVRRFTQVLAAPLHPEDCVVQSMPDVSPTRWHLAHTTWFFETFVLARIAGYSPAHPEFEYLFNSYYNSVGKQFPRAQRGLLSRPTLAEVHQYRNDVDDRMRELLAHDCPTDLLPVIELGLHHEQQHQELILTDIQHVLFQNPLYPAYQAAEGSATGGSPRPLGWRSGREGVVAIGHDGPAFAFDNECPRHDVLLHPHDLADRLVTNGEFVEFIEDGGYQQHALWLSLGWNCVQQQDWQAPLYWIKQEDRWFQFTLRGLTPLDPLAPVSHISYFEADAFARWSGARLPTEFEWEAFAADLPVEGDLAERQAWRPSGVADEKDLQFFGGVWQWTSSAYAPYPGFRIRPGALGEYNGKFMCNQYVLRGGSCATSQSHLRVTYRNFFPPEARWQFSGLRLARDAR